MPTPAFPNLAEPIAVGAKTVRNRIMRLATATTLAEGGRFGDRAIAHYHAVTGGAAIVVIETLHVGGDAFAPEILGSPSRSLTASSGPAS